jgi:hypothetical protein
MYLHTLHRNIKFLSIGHPRYPGEDRLKGQAVGSDVPLTKDSAAGE